MTTEFRAAMCDRVIEVLGGDKALACKNDELSDEVWMDLEKDLKRQLGISSLDYLGVENPIEVKAIISKYELPLYLCKKVDEFNKGVANK